jgi:hypothetical protein
MVVPLLVLPNGCASFSSPKWLCFFSFSERNSMLLFDIFGDGNFFKAGHNFHYPLESLLPVDPLTANQHLFLI